MWLCYALEKGRNGDLMSFSQNHIDVEVNMVGLNQKWRCTGFYGVADQAVKHRSWALLRHLATQSTLPWIVGEGYNEILSNEENEGGVARLDQLNEMFRLALMDCSLMDLSYEGDKFTWSNNKEAPYTVRCRLDMVCASSAWTTMFPNSFVEHLKYSASDHVPILFHTQRPAPIFGGTVGVLGDSRLDVFVGRSAKESIEIVGRSIGGEQLSNGCSMGWKGVTWVWAF